MRRAARADGNKADIVAARDIRGEKNPNWRDAAKRTCVYCHGVYSSYQKGRRFCSKKCYQASKPLKPPTKQIALDLKFAPVPKAPRVLKSQRCACIKCGTTFTRYRSQQKRYCSYRCHLDDGGALRAGLAARAAKMKYGAKKDANHVEVFEKLREVCPAVYDLSNHGCGLPDGVAWVAEEWRLFEVKNPKTAYGRRGLNKVQRKWLNQWKGGPVYMIYTVDEAAKFGCGDFDGIKVEGGGKKDE